MKLRIAIPKVLEIENFRLQILHLTVLFLSVVALSVRVLVFELYSSTLPSSTVVQLTVRPSSLKDMLDFAPRDEPLCQASRRLEIWQNLTVQCDRICPFDVYSPQCCANPYELIEQNTYDSVFLLTNRAERCISRVGTVLCERLPESVLQYDMPSDFCPRQNQNVTLGEALEQLRTDMQAGGGSSISASTLLTSSCESPTCMRERPCLDLRGICDNYPDNVACNNDSVSGELPRICRHSPWLPLDQPIAADQHVDASGFEHSIYPSVAKLELRLTYAYEITGSPPWVPWAAHYSLAGSAENALSVLLDRHDGIGRIYSPNQDLVLPVSELIALAHGLPEKVAAELPQIAPEILLGGGEITVYTDCFTSLNDVRSPDLRSSLEDQDFTGIGTARPLCLVNVSWTNVPGVSSLPITWVEAAGARGLGRLFRKTGLRIRSRRGAGVIRFFDLNVLLVEFTSALVVLRLPVWLVQFFVLFGLGHLSRVYRRAARDVHSIPDECGSTVCRLAMQSLAFRELGAGGRTVSEAELHARLNEVLRHRRVTLDAKEVTFLSEFCFRQVCMRSPFTELNIDAFCSACSSGDAVCLEHMSELFDADRRLSVVERLFTPPELRAGQREVIQKRLDDSAVSVEPSISSAAELGLDEELRQLRRSCAGQEEQLGALRQEVVQLRQQLAEMSEKCRGELASVRDGLAAQVTATTSFPSRLQAFQAELARLKAEPNKFHEARIEARLTASEARADELSTRLEEMQSQWRMAQPRGGCDPELQTKFQEMLATLQESLVEGGGNDSARRWVPAHAGGVTTVAGDAECVRPGLASGAAQRLRPGGSPVAVALPRVQMSM